MVIGRRRAESMRALDTKDCPQNLQVQHTKPSLINLTSFSELVGFPKELIKEELLLEGKVDESGELEMQDLREAMVNYLNQAWVEE